MKIYSIKASKVGAPPCMVACVAEAAVETDEGGMVYVVIQEYDGLDMTVSKNSVFDFLAGDGKEPATDFLESYGSLKEAKTSVYAPVMLQLRKAIRMLG